MIILIFFLHQLPNNLIVYFTFFLSREKGIKNPKKHVKIDENFFFTNLELIKKMIIIIMIYISLIVRFAFWSVSLCGKICFNIPYLGHDTLNQTAKITRIIFPFSISISHANGISEFTV